MGIFKRKETDEDLQAKGKALRPETKEEMELWNKLQGTKRHDEDPPQDGFSPRHTRMDVGDCAAGGTILSPPED
jgi:hypothetical protein